jgi:cation/acetate symporter
MQQERTFKQMLGRYYAFYSGGFVLFVLLLALAEYLGMPPKWLGYVFLFVTMLLYAGIGVMSRTADVAEYYVAGRKVPAMFNGMATAADWMSAASFISLAGSLYFDGYQGLAFVMGWTGGYVLVALLLAPYLRKFGQYTIPDFLGARYGGNLARSIGILAAITTSFVYVVAQIYGVGLITSRFVGLQFEIGVFVGLAGILVCSFLGGMRAVTWTQVAQYVVLIVAYLVPVMLLAQKATGVPLPQATYGTVLAQLSAKERTLFDTADEQAVRALYAERARAFEDKLARLPDSLDAERQALNERLAAMKAQDLSAREVTAIRRAAKEMPGTPEEARERWSSARAEAAAKAQRPQPHAQPHPGANAAESDVARRNFLALTFCLMLGTAALPHILMRYYTTPSVRQARSSVFWSLLFILLLYVTAPAYAVLAKWEIYNHVVGATIATLPDWALTWGKVGLVRIEDINRDGVLQLAELTLDPDLIVLAMPEIAGLPYVVSGLVAAGGLAAALSTADGLLLTIANALSHDLYYKIIDPRASTQTRLVVSKTLLLVVAVFAAWVASLKPAHILFMVGLAFSLAASAFFPALVCGIFWKRANKWGAVAGMAVGLGVALWYAVATHPFFGIRAPLLFEINPISAGVFGVPAGFVVLVCVSLLTRPPEAQVRDLIESVRYPRLR